MNSQPDLDQPKADGFAQRVVDCLNDAAFILMASIGHRTGLFDTMASMGPSTSGQIATEAGLNERYVREWLAAMATARVVEFDPRENTYHLPPEHAASLTRSASPNNLAVAAQWIPLLGSVEPEVVEAFRHGRGVPYSAYRGFEPVMAEESNQTIVAALIDHILPLEPRLVERLEGGIDVLDVGCGSGQAMIHMARRFPRSRFSGYDFLEESIAVANDTAAREKLSNIRFAVRDAARMEETAAFDLITAFDAIHDQARPAQVLSNVARALRAAGLFLVQDISGTSHLHSDMEHPWGTLLYTVSCMHCMSVSLAAGGPGLGAMWGKETALAMFREAGFNDIRVESLAHDPMNLYYIARRR